MLKDNHWRFGLKSQLEWFKTNVKVNDIHNLLYIKKKLAGYTLLRKRTCRINNSKNEFYLLFDTLIIHTTFRKQGLSKILMIYNNSIIKKLKCFSFLLCEDKLIKFYEKNFWTIIDKKKFIINGHKFNSNGMVFNLNRKKIKQIIYYVNK